MDVTVQAVSGLMSVTGFPDGAPVKAGPALVDFMSGIHLYAGVMTALYERQFTGVGRLVEVAMQEAVFPALASNLAYMYDIGRAPPRTGNRHGGLSAAPYNVYPARDGHIAIIATNDKHWTNLLQAMGRTDLSEDPRFSDKVARVRNMDETDRVQRSSHACARHAGMARASAVWTNRDSRQPDPHSWSRQAAGSGLVQVGRKHGRGAFVDAQPIRIGDRCTPH
jgi:crotonobetainyl-CoA:carnitine CoA-transferase CaiB-like acyl-CoA transferase